MGLSSARGADRPVAGTLDSTPPLIAHVIHELNVGGLENGLVNLVNRMPAARYRHAIVCMTSFTDFRKRICRDDVRIYAMNRETKPLWRTYVDLFLLFRRLRPSIVHGRNLSGLDALLPAACARVPVRVHGEHGRDVSDLDGSNRKHQSLKRTLRPLVTHYTSVSRELEDYLARRIGVSPDRITQIYNGVDTTQFHPSVDGPKPLPFDDDGISGSFVVGTVGRLQPVKDQVTLVRAFAAALQRAPDPMGESRLILVGEGPSRGDIEAAIRSAGVERQTTLLGARDDVAQVLRRMHVFVLPSLAEGISNTLLEAMASGLPVIATRVGGNPDLVASEITGELVNVGDWEAIATHIVTYAQNPALRARHAMAARHRAEQHFSLEAMVERYLSLYDALLAEKGGRLHG